MGQQKVNSIAILTLVGLGMTGTVSTLIPPAASAPTTASRSLEPAAIQKLRAQGPAGLQAFLTAHQATLNAHPTKLPPPQLRTALDALCQQRDCHASRLYWYTDLKQAQAAAQATGKPILSLRLLGRLDEELSCANSRFFRIALYPNQQVSQVLRDRFILHWQSVRPVPKITIDFGDGRKLERTLTGNSIHYVLTPNGQPIEALPGLYGPQAFLQQLQQAEQAVQTYTRLPAGDRPSFLRQYHQAQLNMIAARWRADLSQLGIRNLPDLPSSSNQPTSLLPNAQEAGVRAYAKALVERPMVQAVITPGLADRQALAAATDETTWNRLAELHVQQSRLDQNSQALMRSKNLTQYGLEPADNRPSRKTDPLAPVLAQFETAIARDTVRNEYLLHTQLHQWFIQGDSTRTVDRLNARVYANLFLTPHADPWLGLMPENAYSAIEGDGIRQ